MLLNTKEYRAARFWAIIFFLHCLFLKFIPANATQLKSIIDAMAIKSTALQTNSGWEDMSKIRGVKWEWPYYESGAHGSTMIGKTTLGKSKNPNIGSVEVVVTGARTMVMSVKISIANEMANIKIFGKGKTTKLNTTCDNEAATFTIEFYRFEKSGYKPLYISYISSWGAGGAGAVYFEITHSVDNTINNWFNSCSLIQQ